MSPASSRAADSGSSARRVTIPSRRASSPLNTRPVNVRSLATSLGTSRGKVWLIDISGISPHLTSMTDRRESRVAILMSAPSAICSPPPRQLPWTAAITGTGSVTQS